MLDAMRTPLTACNTLPVSNSAFSARHRAQADFVSIDNLRQTTSVILASLILRPWILGASFNI